jgi:hypothetical protein
MSRRRSSCGQAPPPAAPAHRPQVADRRDLGRDRSAAGPDEPALVGEDRQLHAVAGVQLGQQAADLLALAQQVRDGVQQALGVRREPAPRLVGCSL